VYRAVGSDLAVRMTEEAQARRNIVDALETTQDTLMSMRESKLPVYPLPGHIGTISDPLWPIFRSPEEPSVV
jgi:hypothetical protein